MAVKMGSSRALAVVLTSIAACAPAASALAPPALGAVVTLPVNASTGSAQHVLQTSALLTASIDSKGLQVSYYFKYGTTPAFGSQTPLTTVPNTGSRVKVGQAVSRLLPATRYRYRLVVVGPEGRTKEGSERTFMTKGSTLHIAVVKSIHATYGVPFILTGTLTGTGLAGHQIALQASPFPFLEAFTQIGRPDVTNTAGGFSFRVGNIVQTTQLRVVTLDPLPIYSPTITVSVQPRVTMHVRTSSVPGLDRIYGTISPAVKGAHVLIQVQKAVRPGRSEVTERYVTQFSTGASKGSGNSSRYSYIARIRRGGRYRVMVQMPRGRALVSGTSSTTAVLRAAAGTGKG